jgi:hypothetical protein
MAPKILTNSALSQVQALHSDLYEVGVFDSHLRRMTLRTWDPDRLSQSLPWLRHENANGKDIYVRPYGEHAMSLVDDLTADGVTKMVAAGVQPAAVIETSPGNFHAWVHHGKVLPKDVSTQIARDLASEFGGDRKAADWRHFGRLAGFTNQKPAHRKENGHQPYCRLLEATGETYARASEFIDRAEAFVAMEKVIVAQRREVYSKGAEKPIDAFRADPRYGGDGHRIDYAYSLYALSNGVSEQQVAAALATRDLSKKGTPAQQQKYIDGTIQKVLRSVGRGR